VIGNDLTVTMAAVAGQLQLNAFEPVIIYNILPSMRLIARAMNHLAQRCVDGISANEVQCRRGAEASVALATALIPLIGYERAVEIAKAALERGMSVLGAFLLVFVIQVVLARLLDPLAMTGAAARVKPE
jgi:aspartate ammonia-lyase